MKKLLVVLMVLAFTGTVQANMLANPGFEDYTVDPCSGEPTFDGWTVFTWVGGTAAVSPDPYEGLVSLDLGSVSGWNGGAAAYQAFPMSEGVTVSIFAYAKDLTLNGAGDANNFSGIDMVFFGAVPTPEIQNPPSIGSVYFNLYGSFGVDGSIDDYSGSLGAPDANGWMYVYLEAVAPAGTSYMKFEVNNNNDDGQVLFDNVVGIPEPVTIALLGLGGLLLRRRK